jgi:pyruvate-ferredoxin/flavodoxin oxidoreductase
VNCVLWGLGSDGTVGANKAAIKIIGNHTDLYAQGYFAYDSKKSGGLTMSHLRFGKKPIRSPYLVSNPDYVACHNKAYVVSYDMLKGIQSKGVFVLNCDWSQNELDEILPAAMKRTIAKKNIAFYTIDAISIAGRLGLGNRINMIMQAAFFKLVNIIPPADAAKYLKESIQKTYGKKGEKIVEMNNRAVDAGMDSLTRVVVPDSWRTAVDKGALPEEENDFISRIHTKMAHQAGDDLPVSAFRGMEDGSFPLGTTAFEKRGIAVTLPEWQIDRCIQCGFCSYVCPHATIRLIVLNEEEEKNKPEFFKTKKATGKELEQYTMRVQVSPYDCTGCGNCADVCPAKGKALIMRPAEEEIASESDNWEYAMTVGEKSSLMEKSSIKGSQLAQPHLEFNGACPGCGETPYIKLITQLFGDRMMIANATGCSSIWGASAPSIAYTTNAEGRGPAWANSLFEDNAEYGFGMALGVKQIRKRLKILMEEALREDFDGAIKDAFGLWIAGCEDAEKSRTAARLIAGLLEDAPGHPLLDEIRKLKDFLVKRSIWIVGGDGWAYDIGYGGVDQVLSTGEDVNLFVMDTEVYSNTGGQASKSTPYSAVAKFTYKGKRGGKKDLGRMAMTYGSAYVAQISMGANMKQTLSAIVEAEAYKGPSLIIAYAPCINHGIKTGMGTSIFEEKKAVESGYWHLYRYNPELAESGKNPFTLDSKDPTRPYIDFLKGEMRYTQLQTVFPDIAEDMFKASEKQAMERLDAYKRMAAQQPAPES